MAGIVNIVFSGQPAEEEARTHWVLYYFHLDYIGSVIT